MSPHPLDALFTPRSIVVVGGSDRPRSVGRVLLENLRKGGYEGDLYVVNHHRTQVQGLPSHPSVRELGRAVDLALIAVPASSTPAVLRDCVQSSVRAAVVLSAGFSEVGPRGLQLQQELVAIARAGGVRLLGPNCLGLVRPSAKLHAIFGNNLAQPGRLALLSQSGAIGTALLDWAELHEIGFSLLASLGDAADLGFGELLDYLALDPETSAILLYVEGIRQARRFVSGLRAAARMKPVVVLKAGRSKEGGRAAASHTGALIGGDDVFHCALRRAGAVRAHTLEQLFSAAELLASGRRTAGNRLAIVTNAGGPGVLAADWAADRGLSLSRLSAPTTQALDAALPPHWSHGNPIDVLGDAGHERYVRALAAVTEDPSVDGVLVLATPQAMTEPDAVSQAVIERAAATRKPVFACFMGGPQMLAARAALSHHGVAEFSTPELAVEAFACLANFERNQRLLLEVPGPLSDRRTPDLAAARAIVERALAQDRTLLSLTESKALLSAFHIPVTQTLAAGTADQAWQAALEVGLPVALKIDSPDITHKSDVDGVRLGLTNEAQVREAFEGLLARARGHRPDARLRGVSVEPMRATSTGRELLAGIASDPAFGPVVSFGAGGLLVELWADRSVALPPLNATVARDMIQRTRSARWLGQFRNLPPIDLQAVEDVLLRLSELACELPQVRELDINPLIADERGAIAVDARVVLAASSQPAVARYAHLAIEPFPAQLARQIVVRDGHKLLLRPLRPEDGAFEKAFVRNLSLQSRYFRFHHGLAELTPQMVQRFTQLDYDREMAFIALDQRDGVEEEVGVSRYVQDPDGRSCQFSLVVADAWQKRGVGTALMEALIEHARGKGLTSIRGEVLFENRKMLRLMDRMGFEIEPTPGEPTLRTVTLPLQPNPT